MNNWQPSANLETLQLRAQLLSFTRAYFAETAALEVETPTLSYAAVSDVHLASIQAQVCDRPTYLHTSPEYAMKRLLAAGSGDIYQIARVYRDGECGRFHNPEFTMIEWYRLNVDHHQLMDDVEQLIRQLLPERCLHPSERITYQQALHRHAHIDALNDQTDCFVSSLESAGIDIPATLKHDRDGLLDLIMSVQVGPALGKDGLTFIYDYPASQASLAKIRGPVASRFELYLDGLELANGFHELGDAIEQRKRFSNDIEERQQRSLPVMPIDERFLSALEHGLPNCAGVALGFDRLVMCAKRADHINEVLTFPYAQS